MNTIVQEDTKLDLGFIEESLRRLARNEPRKLDSVIQSVEVNGTIDGTLVTTHCHIVQFDGNGRVRITDLVEATCDRVIDYCFPRSKINKAKQDDESYGGNSNIMRLARDAAGLFTNLTKTGEGGELLIFVFAEEYLKLPQVLTKMSLKTDEKMHFHGVDGVYADVVDQKLCLYWGESKMKKDPKGSLYECLKSLACFLKGEDEDGNHIKRDVQLLQDYIDLDNTQLEEAIKKYLDRKNPEFNCVESRGIALAGFDEDSYPTSPNQKTLNILHEEILQKLPDLKKYIKKRTGEENIETFSFHMFMVPLPSVEEFRAVFLKTLGLSNVNK